MTPSRFVAALAAMRLPAVFNPYADVCETWDRADAPRLRRRNLEAFLETALALRVDTIWIARDLGYRGGRRTGLPLTDDVHLPAASLLYAGLDVKRATKGPIVAERTAAVVWKVLADIQQPVVLWNVFPFHPHEPGDSFSNRCHNASERDASLPVLQDLISMFQPKRLVAIGRDAQAALKDIGVPLTMVRHPSYGGQSEFIASLHQMYNCRVPAIDPEFQLC